MVQLTNEDFKKMTDRIKEQDDKISELEAANLFLNDQIKEYNKEFAIEESFRS